MVTERLEDSLQEAIGLAEPSLKTSRQEGLSIAKTLVRTRQKVPVRIMNVSDRDQALGGGQNLGHCELVTWTELTDKLEPHQRRLAGSVSNCKECYAA